MRAALLHIDPVVAIVNALANWAWHQVAALADVLIIRLVFQPIQWESPVLQLYGLSRDLAWSLAGLLIVAAAIKSMWPQFSWPHNRWSISFFLERVVAAGLMGMAGVWVVQALLQVNNAVVAALLANATHWNPLPPSGGVLSPVVVLVVSLAMLLLILYLALFYAVRVIELFLLTAAIPWFALWWATRDDDVALSNLGREMGVVIFIQSFHAGAFWLAVRLMSQDHWGVTGFFLELALLWYMTKLPSQLRRLVGASPGGTRLWR